MTRLIDIQPIYLSLLGETLPYAANEDGNCRANIKSICEVGGGVTGRAPSPRHTQSQVSRACAETMPGVSQYTRPPIPPPGTAYNCPAHGCTAHVRAAPEYRVAVNNARGDLNNDPTTAYYGHTIPHFTARRLQLFITVRGAAYTARRLACPL